MDAEGKREGKGKITYDDGGYYDGGFKGDKFHGEGVYKWYDGEGLFARLFKGAPPLDENGKPMFKYNGDWGSWDGEVDEDNKRRGKGKITYKSGSLYEGCFVNNKYEDSECGDVQVARW